MKTPSAWIRRLAFCGALSLEEQRALDEASANSRAIPGHEAIAKAGAECGRLFVVLDGLACRFKLLPDGRRQILGYLLPGDMCDTRQLLMAQFDHTICTLVPSDVATLDAPAVHRLERYPGIATAFARYSVTQQAVTREWLVNVGHRTAFERIGHLVCEMFARFEAVGLTHGHTFDLPLTQAELGDTLALSSVHVNRTLMELRRLKLVTFQNRQIKIHDYPALRAAAGFDPAYLQAGLDPNPLSIPIRA
jgi:CRP-like cAMP-binding protein